MRPAISNPWKSLVVFMQQLKGDYSRSRARHPVPSLPCAHREPQSRIVPAAASPAPGQGGMGAGRGAPAGSGSTENQQQRKHKGKGRGKEPGLGSLLPEVFSVPILGAGQRDGKRSLPSPVWQWSCGGCAGQGWGQAPGAGSAELAGWAPFGGGIPRDRAPALLGAPAGVEHRRTSVHVSKMPLGTVPVSRVPLEQGPSGSEWLCEQDLFVQDPCGSKWLCEQDPCDQGPFFSRVPS